MSEDPQAVGPADKRAGETTSPRPAAPTAKAHAVRRRKSRKARAAQMREAAKRGSAAAAKGRRRIMIVDDHIEDLKPSMPALDPLAAAQEEARHAKEGNVKLARAVDILREGLELLVVAEIDRKTGIPVDAPTLRQLAAACLDKYSQHVGQNWRAARNKLTGPSLAGTKGNKPVHESQMGMPPEE